jgi:hypothetical protein
MDKAVSELPADRRLNLEEALEFEKYASCLERVESLRGRKAEMEAGPGMDSF